MTQPEIVLARIDNRLVHGQVGNSWVAASGANLIVVADDACATDEVQKSLMKMTADSAGVGIRFFSLQKTIGIIHQASPSQRIFIVTATPAAMRQLMEGGVPIREVNVGNMHATSGKTVFHDQHVYVDDKDLADFKAMSDAGASVYVQIAPGDRKYDV